MAQGQEGVGIEETRGPPELIVLWVPFFLSLSRMPSGRLG